MHHGGATSTCMDMKASNFAGSVCTTVAIALNARNCAGIM